jgi:hypothetical protein
MNSQVSKALLVLSLVSMLGCGKKLQNGNDDGAFAATSPEEAAAEAAIQAVSSIRLTPLFARNVRRNTARSPHCFSRTPKPRMIVVGPSLLHAIQELSRSRTRRATSRSRPILSMGPSD